MINHTHYITFACFDENCTQTSYFPKHYLKGGEIILFFLQHNVALFPQARRSIFWGIEILVPLESA